MSSRAVAVVFTALIALSFGAWQYVHRGSPGYSLTQIRKSIESKNRLKFEQYVDVDRVVTSSVDAVVGKTMVTSLSEGSTGLEALGAALGASMVDKLKPALATTLKSSILKAVESGRMDSIFAAKDTSARQINLALFENSTGASPTGFEGVSDIQREGNAARVGLRFRNEDLDTTLVLYARLERFERRWKVVGFDDFESYLEDIAELQNAHLRQINTDIDRRLNGALRLGDVRRRVRSLGYYSDYVYLTVPIENIGRDTVLTAIVVIEDIDAPSWTDRAVMLDHALAPGATTDAEKILDYNQFIDWHTQLRYADVLNPRVAWAVIKRGVTTDTVYRYDTWEEYRSRTR